MLKKNLHLVLIMKDLKGKLKDMFLDEVAELKVDFSSNVRAWGIEYQNLIAFMYKSGITDDSEVESALEKAVFNRAQKDYKILIGPSMTKHPDHLGDLAPYGLAYAIQHGQFSDEEIGEIDFDGDKEDFLNEFGGDGLIERLRSALLYPEPYSKEELEGGRRNRCYCCVECR